MLFKLQCRDLSSPFVFCHVAGNLNRASACDRGTRSVALPMASTSKVVLTESKTRKTRDRAWQTKL